jgi:hypothetical protein
MTWQFRPSTNRESGNWSPPTNTEKRSRPNLYVRSQTYLFPTKNGQEPNRCMIPHFDPLSADDRPKTDGYAFTDPVALEPVDHHFDEPGPQSI